MSNFVSQSLLVYRTDLLQQNDRIPIEAVQLRINLHMCRQLRFLNLRGNGGDDDGWAEAVTDIVLDNQDRPDSTLLGADDRGQVRKVNIATLTYQ